MTLVDAIGALNDLAATLDGIRRVYADPPESINEFPAGVTYIGDGTYEALSFGNNRGIHTLMLDIYEARQVLPQAINSAKRWPDLVFTALRADITLNGDVSHAGTGQPMIRYRAQPMPYGDMIYYGVRFWISVKVNYA